MSSPTLPPFLTSAESFANHLYEQFADSTNSEKGDRFLEFAMALVASFDEWKDYDAPVASLKKSHDKGVDFRAVSGDGKTWLCGQSKFQVSEVAHIDGIVSKFQDFAKQIKSGG